MSKLVQLFREHPASVGESYFQHMGASFSFGLRMLKAASAALVHGIFPFLCVRTGSNTITQLHDRMVANRSRNSADAIQ